MGVVNVTGTMFDAITPTVGVVAVPPLGGVWLAVADDTVTPEGRSFVKSI